MIWEFGPGWTDPKNDSACREWTRVMSKKARAELEKAKAKGTDAETQKTEGEYGNMIVCVPTPA
jgi:hypothetical protein